MRPKTRQITAISLAVLAILSIAGGGALAATTYDTSGTGTTSTQSDVSGTSATVDLRPGNSSEFTYVEVNSTDTSNVSLELRPEDSDGDVVNYTAYENTSAVNVSTKLAGSTRYTHWAVNISHDELEDLPRDVDGGDYRLEIYDSGDDEVLNTSVTFDYTGDDNNRTAVIAVADTTEPTHPGLADRIEITEKFGWFGAEEFWTDNGTDVSTYSAYTAVNATNTSIELHLEDEETADAYSEAAEPYEDGDWVHPATLWVNGIPLKTYKNEAPDDLDADEDSYAVYNEDDDEIELVLNDDREDFEDFRTVQIRAVGGDGYNFGTLISEFGAGDAAATFVPT